MKKYKVFQPKIYSNELTYSETQQDKLNMNLNGWLIKTGWNKVNNEFYIFEKVN